MSKKEKEQKEQKEPVTEQAADQAPAQEETPKQEPQAPETAKAEPKESEAEQLQKKLAAEHDNFLRLAAEYDNFRKRSRKEKEALYTDVKAETAGKFLPVFDDLERALANETADEAYKKGVEMTFNQLMDVFKKLGVEEIESVGKTFDPALHNAVMHIEDAERGENEIVEEFQKGFRIGDKVIRFSMVKVAN
jgi:molecular chaperone GrpE